MVPQCTMEKTVGNTNLRSPYTRYDDCCYGCPYVLCPSRPTRPMEEERPNCIWKMYQNISKGRKIND